MKAIKSFQNQVDIKNVAYRPVTNGRHLKINEALKAHFTAETVSPMAPKQFFNTQISGEK